MTGSQSIAITTVLGLGLALVPAAWADPASDACAALADARSALYSMINAKDKSAKSAQVALNAKVQAASAKLDSVLAGMTGAETKAAADFKAVWDQFKATREEEIIPAIYKGNVAEAKKITDGSIRASVQNVEHHVLQMIRKIPLRLSRPLGSPRFA
jgi:predicted PolB exonuclease-like 3'-5' exonuclease